MRNCYQRVAGSPGRDTRVCDIPVSFPPLHRVPLEDSHPRGALAGSPPAGPAAVGPGTEESDPGCALGHGFFSVLLLAFHFPETEKKDSCPAPT